jgi:hypothetical protein
MRRILMVVPAVTLVAALAACGSSDDDDDTSGTAGDTVPTVTDSTPPTTGSAPTSGPPTSTPSTPPSSTAPVPPVSIPGVSIPQGTPIEATMPLVVAAVDDLAAQLGVAPDEVTVVQALSVTWPDGSLGCPEPGMMYTQALVDGTFVLLEAGGEQYQYHGGDPLFRCEPGSGPFAPES